MAATAGGVVANLYYNQPLLAEIAVSLGHGQSPSRVHALIGLIPSATQLGYALGLLTLVPLGDLLERRRLILTLLGVVSLVLVATASASSLIWLAVASLALGMSSAVPQLIVPLAAGMAACDRRGRAVGIVMSGLLTGILLSRTVSGLMDRWLGWRAIFWAAAPAMLGLAAMLYRLLPVSPPVGKERPRSYLHLLGSLGTVLRTQPLLLRSALTTAMSFGAFSAFWCTLTFLLSAPPFNYSPFLIGCFGLTGVAGAIAVPWAGHLCDRHPASFTVGLGLTTLATSFAILSWQRHFLPGLVAGCLCLDLGTQLTLIGNQAHIYSLPVELHSRLNAVFIGIFFVGGAVATYAATQVWSHWGWTGVCWQGGGMACLGLLISRLPVASPRVEDDARGEPCGQRPEEDLRLGHRGSS